MVGFPPFFRHFAAGFNILLRLCQFSPSITNDLTPFLGNSYFWIARKRTGSSLGYLDDWDLILIRRTRDIDICFRAGKALAEPVRWP